MADSSPGDLPAQRLMARFAHEAAKDLTAKKLADRLKEIKNCLNSHQTLSEDAKEKLAVHAREASEILKKLSEASKLRRQMRQRR
jgi:hypothetical protein